MKLNKGNKAIANQINDGKDLLLFEILRKGQIRFVGPFNCAEYSTEKGRDTKGDIRDAIVFHLVPAEDEAPELIETTGGAKPLNELRKSAYASAGPSQKKHGGNVRRSYHVRSEEVRIYVLARADGNCESCLNPAPFKKSDDEPYLEPHHIRRLTDGGPDNPAFMGAICPNCHREIHHGVQGKTKNSKLQELVTAKEMQLEATIGVATTANAILPAST
jgi:5-methylcytosine-specific restriction protein A